MNDRCEPAQRIHGPGPGRAGPQVVEKRDPSSLDQSTSL